ncbi:hypothetical protein [Brevifollis gellanilyticus]|uniref:Uncharacterized protein n=1 Tax=Brevifollis gellanilyticus TaxID=748831 RepID=A0A512M4D0_9BACT|nr:hypothetical protein [Brevifollis gellanilyticus]GEP41583.1 hypothetical protein BGE01nite_08740 [Brevifollis gellanilyticus]
MIDRFNDLPLEVRKQIQLWLCTEAIRVWERHCEKNPAMAYVETVCGTRQVVDVSLPAAALRCVIEGKDVEKVKSRYGEPIAAMQDEGLVFPDEVTFAYYAIYNLFGRHVLGRAIDDWLIANQALSAQGTQANFRVMLGAAFAAAGVDSDD